MLTVRSILVLCWLLAASTSSPIPVQSGMLHIKLMRGTRQGDPSQGLQGWMVRSLLECARRASIQWRDWVHSSETIENSAFFPPLLDFDSRIEKCKKHYRLYCASNQKDEITCCYRKKENADSFFELLYFSYLDWLVGQPRDAALDNYVRLVINNFFAALDEGIPALGIPVMDPLNIGNLTIPTLE